STFSLTPTSPPAVSPLSLHDALPISLLELVDPLGIEAAVGASVDAVEQLVGHLHAVGRVELERSLDDLLRRHGAVSVPRGRAARSEEHTSELQSRSDLVCRLLLEKKK